MWQKKKLILEIVFIYMVLSNIFLCEKNPNISLTPEWAKNLIIYEVAIKGFTSPNGPESGTFNSLKEKMGYLKKLGINGIWLTGHSLSDSSHFYGIWTQYACIEPDKIDPSLGSEQEFKDMIAEAHKHGIRIFLDTIEHGVMNDSPLIIKHPDWFKDGSWGMTDYDWTGNHPQLEKWWIEMWTKAVLDWGVDGFRCDCGLHRPDLWLEIKRRCAKAGKPIFILGESGSENVSDACQRDIMLFDQRKGLLDNHTALTNLASMRDLLHQNPDWESAALKCSVIYNDGTEMTNTGSNSELQISFLGLAEDMIGTWEFEPDGNKDWQWLIKGIDQKRSIERVVLAWPDRNWHWQSKGWGWKMAIKKSKKGLIINGGNPLPGPKMRVISPSCHDAGWEGFPLDKNPYMVQNSRFVFGYGVLFTPAIPIFMSGEEFDADYRPLPRHTPDLYGKEEAGTGRWLYASWLNWNQVKETHHKQMFEDVQRMIEIRRNHQDIIHAVNPENNNIKLSSVLTTSDVNLPVPYIISNGKKALLIAGNPLDFDVEINLNIDEESLGIDLKKERLKITELWPDEKSSCIMSIKELSKFSCTIPADGKAGGGLQVIRIEEEK